MAYQICLYNESAAKPYNAAHLSVRPTLALSLELHRALKLLKNAFRR